MAWNKPSEPKVEVKGGGGQRKVYLKGILVGAVAVVIGAVCIFAFSGKSEKPVEKSNKAGGRIKEVTPARAPKTVEEPAEKEVTKEDFLKMAQERHQKLMEAKKNRDPNRPRKTFGHVDKPGAHNPPRRLYDTQAENYVAGLIRGKVGMVRVGVRLPATFDEEFKARIADPLKDDPDDTPEDRAVRERMQEVKKEMAKMIGDGMTPSEIILAERKELNHIASLRNDMLRGLCDLRKNNASAEDIDDYVAAANIKLTEYGAEHIKIPAFLKENQINAESQQKED